MTTRRSCLETSSDESELSDNDILTISEMSLEENPQTWLCCLPGDNPKRTCDLSGWIKYSVPCNGDKYLVGNVNSSGRQSTGGESSSLGRRRDVTSRGISLFNSKAKDTSRTLSYLDTESDPSFSESTILAVDTKLDLNRNWKHQKIDSLLCDVTCPSFAESPETPLSSSWSETRIDNGSMFPFPEPKRTQPASNVDILNTSTPNGFDSSFILNGSTNDCSSGTIVLKRRSDKSNKSSRVNTTFEVPDSDQNFGIESTELDNPINETFDVQQTSLSNDKNSTFTKKCNKSSHSSKEEILDTSMPNGLNSTFILNGSTSKCSTGTIVLKKGSDSSKFNFSPRSISTPVKNIPQATFRIPKPLERSIPVVNRTFVNKPEEKIEITHSPDKLNSHDDDNISTTSDSSYASSSNLIRSLDDVRTLARQQEESLKDSTTAQVNSKPHSLLKMMGSKKYGDIPGFSSTASKFEIVRSHEVLPTFTQPSEGSGSVGGITKLPEKKDIYRSVQSLQYHAGPSQRPSKLPCPAASQPKPVQGSGGQPQQTEKAVSRIPVKRKY